MNMSTITWLHLSDLHFRAAAQHTWDENVVLKALLADIAAREGISAQQTIAIGDGANDLPMLNAAGLGVAYHAKPVVKETASHAISEFGLDSVLYLMGFSDRDIEEALQG
jgi:hydroxymethylpyrimidine pyrophosphatase-like HAD family hydrolase